MTEAEAIQIATTFAEATFASPCEMLRAREGLEIGEDDRDHRVWTVIFLPEGAPRGDRYQELWVKVDDATGEARQFQTL